MRTFLSTLISLVIATCLAAGTGCKKSTSANLNNIGLDTGLRFLALGDSYTIGQSVPEADRFPHQTVALLRQQNINLKQPEYIAATGWTTANLLNEITNRSPRGPYDIVTLLIGVNDQFQGVDTAVYRQRFIQSLEKAIELAGNKRERVFVVSIPDYSVTPFVHASNKAQVSQQVDWFNSINKQITQQRNVTYVNITPSSREGANNSSLIANDGLHPSGLEYKKWAAMLAPLIKQVL